MKQQILDSMILQLMILILDYNMENKEVKITEKNLMNLKFVMVKKFGEVNYSRLAKEIGLSRQSIYKAINNAPGYNKTRQTILNWIK